MKPRKRGILYSATGPRFVAEAVESAASSLRFNAIPHLIFCDVPPEGAVPDGVECSPFERCGNAFLDKIKNMRRSPFVETLFMDTDTYVAGNLDDVFELLSRFDVAAAHAPGYTKCDDRGQSEAFYEFNTGVIAFRKTPAVEAFLEAWDRQHAAWRANPPFVLLGKDQSAFRRVLWDSALAFYVLSPEYNYRSIFPGRLVGRAKVIHGRSADYAKLEAHLNAATGPRVFPAFPPDHPW
jgi:hypothetical protein